MSGYSGINSHSGHTRFFHTYIKESEHNIHYPNPKDGTINGWDYRPISLWKIAEYCKRRTNIRDNLILAHELLNIIKRKKKIRIKIAAIKI